MVNQDLLNTLSFSQTRYSVKISFFVKYISVQHYLIYSYRLLKTSYSKHVMVVFVFPFAKKHHLYKLDKIFVIFPHFFLKSFCHPFPGTFTQKYTKMPKKNKNLQQNTACLEQKIYTIPENVTPKLKVMQETFIRSGQYCPPKYAKRKAFNL